MRFRLTLCSFLPALCVLLAGAGADAGNWPRFRGPNGTGVSTDKDVPIHFNDKENVLWKAPIPGRGNSSPIVWGDRLFIQSASADGSERWLICVNAVSGEVLWKKSAPGARRTPTPRTRWRRPRRPRTANGSTPSFGTERTFY